RFPIHALTSRSRDGEILSRFVQGFGIRVVRGSSSRGGARALLSLTRVIRDLGENVLIVPGGPRGARPVAQIEAVLPAKMAGVPLGGRPSRVLGSWDAFVVPHPFARATVVFGEPIAVARDADRDLMEAKRCELESILNHLTARADRVVRGAHVPAL